MQFSFITYREILNSFATLHTLKASYSPMTILPFSQLHPLKLCQSTFDPEGISMYPEALHQTESPPSQLTFSGITFNVPPLLNLKFLYPGPQDAKREDITKREEIFAMDILMNCNL